MRDGGTERTIVQVLAHHGEVGLSDFVRHSLGAVPTGMQGVQGVQGGAWAVAHRGGSAPAYPYALPFSIDHYRLGPTVSSALR